MQSWLASTAQKNQHRFYWALVLPVQSILLTAFIAPMYGFNALIEPINTLFSPEHPTSGWPGALSGGLLLLGGGVGSLGHAHLLRLAKTKVRLLVALNLLIWVCFGLGALACELKSLWLLILGFAVPSGLLFSNLFTAGATFLVEWGRRFNRSGLQSGVFGMMFGVWGAAYSFLAPELHAAVGVEWLLIITGGAVCVLGFVGAWLFIEPSEEPAAVGSGSTEAAVQARPALRLRDLLRLPPFYLFFVFFLLFLTPGFGFKIIVQVLSTEVFHATAFVSSMMAVAFLVTYGVSRLVAGVLSDKLPLKPMYALFSGVQAGVLVVMGFTLPMHPGALLFTLMMCAVGGMFAAGKCLWTIVLLKLYGPKSFPTAVRATLPAFGFAGFLGPVTLNWALRASDILSVTSIWLYAMAAALVLCVVLFHALRRVDYQKFDRGEPQGLHLGLRAKSELDRL